jgi:hypothetical protein
MTAAMSQPHSALVPGLARAGVSLCVVLWLVFGAASAQDNKPSKPAEKPATERPADNDPGAPKVQDGHDRPTTYPRIRIASGKNEDGTEGQPGAVKTKTRAYLLDVSEAMAASITVGNSEEMTRLERMVSEVSKSLTRLADRPGSMRFNIVTFGTIQDLAGGGEPWVANADNAAKAKEWLKRLEAKGTGDLYALLKALFDQKPESATMMVGSMPGKPADVSEEELKQHKDVPEFVLAKVKEWRKAGNTTSLDITGIGLGPTERDFYRRLAEAVEGTYLDA